VDSRPFTVLSLCAGVGGLDLGLRLAMPDARTVCFVEIEAYACALLAARMDENALDQAPVWTNLRTFDGKPWRGTVDCITAGYPCQPFSVAGKQLADKDPRHLWPDVFRVVREVEPAFCFFENVAGHLRLGFEQVHDDLRSVGYRVKAGLFTAQRSRCPA
jgi:DNA (cytosine-5)-methyltransferase 1